ncbi:MAG: phytanoyl-CoA dioxygenase family protein [Candidatus Hydrogenedentes bacterium]|nr:phytanoyl-CoA dioxygenase family protein [Candidatus Hydrogenedentota bacterium]
MRKTVSLSEANATLDDAPALWRQADRDGYLLFRGLLDPGKVLSVRRQVLEICARHGWMSSKHPIEAGIRCPDVLVLESGDPRWITVYKEILCQRSFHALAMEPPIHYALSQLFGEAVVTHSRNICRVMFPQTQEYTTPPHQDYLYIRGSENTWTCWIPLGDCPADLGGLALIPGSHRGGFLPSHPGKGAGGQQVNVPDDAEWAASPMHCGDVLLFHSLTIHQGRDNSTQDALRLSVDYRYQPLSEPIHPDSMEPHMAGFGLSWEKIYSRWPAPDSLQYYWKQWALNYVSG